MGNRMLRPLVLQLAPTNACNLACRHCYRSAADRFPEEWGFEAQARTVEAWAELAAAMGRPPVLVLTGGEPLISQELADLVHVATRAGIGIRLNTNGLLASRERIERLASRGLRHAQVSLESPLPEEHEAIRGRGTFVRTARGVAVMREAGMQVWIKVTVGALPMAALASWQELAHAWGVQGVAFARVLPLGRWEGGSESLLPDSAWLEALAAADDPRGLRMVWRDAPFDTRQGTLEGAPWRPEEGRDVLAVDADGTWLVSRRMPVVLGKVGRMGPREAWGHPLMRDLRSWDPGEACGGCPALPACQGGSRAMTWARTGDWRGRDPDCTRVALSEGLPRR